MALEFKGIDSAGYGGYALTDQLLYNLKWWCDWGLLNHGAFGIYRLDSVSFYDTTESQLHLVGDNRYEAGKVWEGAGPEWVWESGVSVPSGEIQPFRVSGVEVDSVPILSSDIGIYSHHTDYQNGRIIFDNPQNIGADIKAEFTRRSVKVGFADSQEFRNIMLDSLEEFQQGLEPSGTPSREHQAWLPSIFIDVTDGSQRGLQLGGGQIKTRTINFHVFADNPGDRNLLIDWLDFQSRSAFFLADLNNIIWPFDQYGDIVLGVTNWPDMVNQFPWKKMRVMDGRSTNINSLNQRLFRGRVTWEVDIDIGNI